MRNLAVSNGIRRVDEFVANLFQVVLPLLDLSHFPLELVFHGPRREPHTPKGPAIFLRIFPCFLPVCNHAVVEETKQAAQAAQDQNHDDNDDDKGWNR